MTKLNQTLIVSRLTLGGLRQRLGSSLVIIIGMACVTGVLISMLSVTVGMMRVLRASGDPSRAIVLFARTPNEGGSDLDRTAVGTILNAPGIARGADGRPLADAEMILNAPPADGFAQGSLGIEGIGREGIALRPKLRIVSGRMFRAGQQELIVGAAAERVFHFKVGDKVIMPGGEWPIVGEYTSGGILEDRLMGDAETLMATAKRGGFGSVIVRLASPSSFAAFKKWLTTNPTLAVTAERQTDYYVRHGWGDARFYETMAYFVGAIMSVGALFGAINILYSAVRARTREIATLRALGYESLPLAASVTFESLFLSLLGALSGSLIAWALFNGHESNSGIIFRWSISAYLVALGVSWAMLLAILGSLFPAIRAARLPITEALHE